MKNFIDIPTPYLGIITRKQVDSPTFRPAATGFITDELDLRFQMEALEVEASVNQEPGYISTAAHTTKSNAIRAALNEADERISAAAWWVYDRPLESGFDPLNVPIDSLESEASKEIRSIAIGFVDSCMKRGVVAVSILQGDTYPFAVLGASISEDRTESASKAFIESVQSWTASKWLRTHEPDSMPLWDVAELNRRATIIRQSEDSTRRSESSNNDTQNSITESLVVKTRRYNDRYVAWVYATERVISGTSLSLASLARRLDEQPQVFTNHNL